MSANLGDAALFTFSHMPGMAVARESKQPGHDKNALRWGRTAQAMNVLGYIPVVSVIVGIARMILAAVAAKSYPELQPNVVAMQCFRGAFEILCLGPLMILSDAITSIWLACQKP